jgi:glyoxalase family protein
MRHLCPPDEHVYLPREPSGKDHSMLDQIHGLHHVTSMASGARENNAFFTRLLGLRRVKKTVNFDAPDVYHLYYGDGAGSPGTVMTYFPFPDIGQRRRGAGEVGQTRFTVPRDALPFWAERLAHAGVEGLRSAQAFGEDRLDFLGPDGDEFALVATEDARTPWTGGGIPAEAAIRGFHGVTLRLPAAGPTDELLRFMGFEVAGRDGHVTRYRRPGGNGADAIEIEQVPAAPRAVPGAGSVHHIAFSVADRTAQTAVRRALAAEGFQVTPPIDRDYFWAIYFRSPGGVLFEVATDEPGFARDEDPARLGEGLMLPGQHAHLRDALERRLEPIE